MAHDELSRDVWDDDPKPVLSPPPDRAIPVSPAETTELPTAAAADEPLPAVSSGDSEDGGAEREMALLWSTANRRTSSPDPSSRGARALSLADVRPDAQEVAFDRRGTTRVGLLGGKGVGKSYLFQAMVYRTLDGRHSGALSYYIDHDTVRVYQTRDRSSVPRSAIPSEFVQEYRSWLRLGQTNLAGEQWYRLRLQFRTGLFGRRRSFLDIDFLDGSGESLEMGLSTEREATWRAAFLDASVMVFCLPLWAAFPASGGVLSAADWEAREDAVQGFDAVVRHFRDLREKHEATHPVRSILALTMADDRRAALTTLRNRWITPYLEEPRLHLEAMRTGSGVARYLASARQVSAAIFREFDASQDPRISGIPERIEFGGGRPWFIPLSAIDGASLDSWEQGKATKPKAGLRPPVPVHVELPLLVALCESHNALM